MTNSLRTTRLFFSFAIAALFGFAPLSSASADTIQFSTTSYTVAETGSATITVTRTGTAAGVKVQYATSNGTALTSSDYTAKAGTLSFGANVTSQTFTVPIVADTRDESNETVNLTLSGPVGATLGSPANATLTITDNDNGGSLQFSAAAIAALETGPTIIIAVTRTGGLASGVTVSFATSNGTALAGSDYTAANGTLSFGANATSRTFAISLLNDTRDESNETVNLTLTGATGGAALGATKNATLIITDNDSGGAIQFSAATYSVLESGPSATITAIRTGGLASGVTVNFATSNGTAVAGSDYTAQSGSLSFGASQTSRTFTVPIINDTASEPGESLNLTLTSPAGGATLAAQKNATLAITDNDSAAGPGALQFSPGANSVSEAAGTATITVARTGGSAGAVTVQYATSNGTATAGSDYTASSGTLSFAAGVTTRTFTIPIASDGVVESAETVNLTLSNPTGGATLGSPATGTLTINDTGASGALKFSTSAYSVDEASAVKTVIVTRTGGNAGAVTVQYATSNGTATAGSDYTTKAGTLTIAAGATTGTFNVPIINDAAVEGAETINLTLTNPTGGATLGAPSTATITINDNDNGGSLQFSSASYSVGEAGPTTTITVTRTGGSSGAVTAQYATSDGTATAGSDYTVKSGTLSFNAGATSQTFTVAITNDTAAESSETINLALSNPTGGATLGSPTSATLTITDNDAPGTLQFSAATYNVSEAGPTATITVTRTGGSAGGVTAQYATSDGTATAGSDYTASSGNLSFGAGATSQTFTVPITNDTAAEGAETISLALSNPGGGATLGTPASATLTINDNDAP
jgi:ribosomal protein L35AE/L33A